MISNPIGKLFVLYLFVQVNQVNEYAWAIIFGIVEIVWTAG